MPTIHFRRGLIATILAGALAGTLVVASARAGVRIQDRFTFSIVGSNIFNTQYQETNGFPAPRISLFAEAKFTY